MNTLMRAAAACLVFVTATVAADEGDPNRLLELGHHFPSYANGGHSGLISTDLDGDAIADLAFVGLNGRYIPSSPGTPLLFVGGLLEDGGVGIKQELLVDLPDVIRLLGNAGRLYAVSSTGRVNVYSQWPLRLVASFAISTQPTAVALADVNADGIDELLVASSGSLQSYGTSSGAALWQTTSTMAIRNIVVAQLDADAALEIMASNETTSFIVDGATGSPTAGPARSFTSQAAFLPPIGATAAQIVDAHASGLVSIHAVAPWLQAWSFATPQYPTALIAADVDGDGRAELIYGESGSWSRVHVVDSASHGERLSINGLDSDIKSLAVGDIDDDGVKDIAFSLGDMWDRQLASRIRIVDTLGGKQQYDFPASAGRFSVVALADLNGDGDIEQFAATANNGGDGRVIVSRASDGSILWDSGFGDGATSHPFDISAKSIALGRLTPEGAPQIALARGGELGASLVLIDAITHEARNLAWNVLRLRSIGGVAFVDIDQDGQQDIAVLSSAEDFASPGARIQIFSATTGALIQQTPLFGATNQLRTLLTGDVNGDNADDLIAVLGTTTQAFDGQTLQPLGTLAATASGGSYNRHGLAGPELMLFNSSGGVTFFDASSRQFLRSIAIPAATKAVIALGGDSRQLLSASNNRLMMLDGASGATLASSSYLGTGLAAEGQIAAVALAPGVWQVAVGSDAGYYRHRLEIAPEIFRSGFEQGAAQ